MANKKIDGYEFLAFRYQLGSTLAIRRKMLKLSQEQLAEKSGVNRVVISKIENGGVNMTVDTLYQMLNGLDLKVNLGAGEGKIVIEPK